MMASMNQRKAYLGPTEAIHHKRYEETRKNILDNVILRGFPYSRKLQAHKSCVNTLRFSSGDGRWLASAGDDFRVHLWDMHQEDIRQPSFSYSGPRGNVLALSFSAHNQFMYSGGADNMVMKYDISRIPTTQTTQGLRPALSTFMQHTDSVRDISCHPVQDEIFFSARNVNLIVEDGKVILHDGRVNASVTGGQGVLQHDKEFTGVQAHPIMENIFATCDGSGQVCLRDTRMAFGPLAQRSKQGIVQMYSTKLSKKAFLSNPESSSIAFDRDGTRLCVTMLHFFPTIYSVSDPNPIAVCNGRNNPDGTPVLPGQRTYSNSCTMKSGSFGGPALLEDELYSAGSDNFRGYVWRIPSIACLTARRKEIKNEDWCAQEWPNTVAFAECQSATRYIPTELSTPLFCLNGHKSIINSAVIHPSLLYIATSGVERHITLHSPVSNAPSSKNLPLTTPTVRNLQESSAEDYRLFIRALAGLQPTLHEDSNDSEDEIETISLFDHILRQEGEADVFTMRPWVENDDSESDVLTDSDSDDPDFFHESGGDQ